MFLEFVKDNPLFFNNKPYFLEDAMKVKCQALSHLRRDGYGDFLEMELPNEDPKIKEYRKKVIRNLTRNGIDRIADFLSEVISNTGYTFSASAETVEYLQSNPFEIRGQNVDLQTYITNCIIQTSFYDANAVTINFPYIDGEHFNEEGEVNLPSAIGDNVNGIKIKHLLFEIEEICYFDDDLFAFLGGRKEVREGKETIEVPYYFVADKEYWYIYYPTDQKVDEQRVYEAVEWYRHGTTCNGRAVLPVNFLPGVITKGDNGVYNETFAYSYYEFADEVVNMLSSLQAVLRLHFTPKTWMHELDCTAAGCHKGKLQDAKGHYVKDQNDRIVNCPSCINGKVTNISPYSILKIPNDMGLDDNNIKGEPFGYISPPVNDLASAFQIFWNWYEKMMNTLALDIIGDNVESGEAKEKKLEDRRVYVAKYARSLFDWLERELINLESILNPVENNRVKPQVTEPNSYKVRDLQTLIDDAKNSIDIDRIDAELRVIESQYRNNPAKQRMFELAYEYAPHLWRSAEDLQKAVFAGCISTNDCIKNMNALGAFRTVYRRNENFAELTDEQIFSEVDTLISPKLNSLNDNQATPE